MKYLIYKITNEINNKIYIGMHKTNEPNDGYMGSGTILRKAQLKYGMENFTKEILAVFDTAEEMLNTEALLVDRAFVARTDTYNVALGGLGGFGHLKGTITVKDNLGNTSRVSLQDPKYISGELVFFSTGTTPVKDKEGNVSRVNTTDTRYTTGELISINKGTVVVKDIDGKTFRVSVDDERYISGEFVSIMTGKVCVTDRNGSNVQVSTLDARYTSGELVGINKGKKCSEATKKKIGTANSKIQIGTGNSQYGTMWVYNPKTNESKKIRKEDFSTSELGGWVKGRKINK